MSRVTRTGVLFCRMGGADHEKILRRWRDVGDLDLNDDGILVDAARVRFAARHGEFEVAIEMFADLADGRRVVTSDGYGRTRVTVENLPSLSDAEVVAALEDRLKTVGHQRAWNRLQLALDRAGVQTDARRLRELGFRGYPSDLA